MRYDSERREDDPKDDDAPQGMLKILNNFSTRS